MAAEKSLTTRCYILLCDFLFFRKGLFLIDWLETEISPEDEADILEGIMDLDAGRKIKAEDIWKELKDSTLTVRLFPERSPSCR